MEIKRFTVGPFAENTYLLIHSGQAILVDPGFAEAGEYKTFVKELEASESELIAVCLTHAHVDHVLGLDRVKKNFDVPVYLNHSDLYLWKNFPNQAHMFGLSAPEFDFIPQPLPEQSAFTIGGFTFDVLYTPGHAPDHVSLLFKKYNCMIAGDVLFRDSIGRTDLYKGDFKLLGNSIKTKIYSLPDDVAVYPGHGPETTVGYEKKNNPFVKLPE